MKGVRVSISKAMQVRTQYYGHYRNVENDDELLQMQRGEMRKIKNKNKIYALDVKKQPVIKGLCQ